MFRPPIRRPADDTRGVGRAAIAIALLVCAMPQPAHASAELARERKCLSCHAVDRKLVGPAFRDIARRYAPAGAAIEPVLAQKIRRGGKGAWGIVPMPAMASQVDAAEALTLARWILALPVEASGAANGKANP